MKKFWGKIKAIGAKIKSIGPYYFIMIGLVLTLFFLQVLSYLVLVDIRDLLLFMAFLSI